MKKTPPWKLAAPIPVVLLRRFLDFSPSGDSSSPTDSLLGALVGMVTQDLTSAVILATEQVVFLVIFVLLFGDSISSQQRLGAVYRFSRMPRRTPWYLYGLLALGGWAGIYCGVYVGLNALVSLLVCGGHEPCFGTTALALWGIFTLIAWLAGLGCTLLCGRFGASIGGAVTMGLVLALSTAAYYGIGGSWAAALNPMSFTRQTFAAPWSAAGKAAILSGELALLALGAGRYFCTKDIFPVEEEG